MLQSIIIIKDKNIKKNSLLALVNLEDKEKKQFRLLVFSFVVHIIPHRKPHFKKNLYYIYYGKKVQNYRKNLLFMFLSIQKRRDKI